MRCNLDVAVVLDEPKISEFVHEEVDARTRRPDHFGKGSWEILGIRRSDSR